MNIKVISWNINAMVPNEKKSVTLNYLTEEYFPDLLMLQEAKVHGDIDFVNKMSVMYPSFQDYYKEYCVNSSRGYSGLVTLVKETDRYQIANFTLDCDKKYDKYNNNRITILQDIQHKLVIFNVYIPNSGADLVRMDFKKQWMEEFTKLVKQAQWKGYQIIVIGDVNVVPGPQDIKAYNANHNKSAGCTDQETSYYTNFLIETGLIDVAVKLDRRSEYTFFGMFTERNKLYNAGWRLDHAWISPSINILDYQVLKHCEGSDHCPIFIEVEVNG